MRRAEERGDERERSERGREMRRRRGERRREMRERIVVPCAENSKTSASPLTLAEYRYW